MSTAGDVNGDGFGDVIIGAGAVDRSYVVFGGDFTSSVTHPGDANANTLTGSASANVIVAGQNDDTLLGLGGADVLYAAQGDDLLAIPAAGFRRIAGGRGFDTLRLDAAGLVLNLLNIADNKVTGIEQTDITGTGANTLRVSQLEVLNLSGQSNTLLVRGGADDTVIMGGGWTLAGIEDIGGEHFRVFTQGAAVLKILCDVFAPPGTVPLSALLTGNGAGGVTVFGANASDGAGASVGDAGDVNGDGYGDVIIGAPTAGGTGRAFIVFGRPSWFGTPTLDLATLDGTNGFTLLGENADDHCGYAVSGAGDVNGDGYGDVIVGAPEASFDGDPGSDPEIKEGQAYIVFGKADWSGTPAVSLAALDGTNGFMVFGPEENTPNGVGFAVSGAGDVNDDGYDDVVVAQEHRDAATVGGVNHEAHVGFTFVVFGKASGFAAALDLDMLDGMNGFTLYGVDDDDSQAMRGHAVSCAGDVNGDGIDDLLIGKQDAEMGPDGDMDTQRAGESYVVFGKTSWAATPFFSLASLNGSNGFTIHGKDPDDRSGISVSAAGDFNNDGFDDLIVGADGGDGQTDMAAEAGESYLIFGKANWTGSDPVSLATLSGTNGFKVFGADVGDQSGVSVSGAGDLNNDGFADLIIGADRADASGNAAADAGESYVVYGHAGPLFGTLSPGTLTGVNGFTLYGVDAGDKSGASVSRAGDVNGDGYGDLIIGAPAASGADNAEAGAGESYIVFGGPPLPCETPEIAVEQPAGAGVADGGTRSFSPVLAGGMASRIFTVRNSGEGDLALPAITLHGTDAAAFVIVPGWADPVAPAGATTFEVVFAPASPGMKTAVVRIACNDADENPFDITLSGAALADDDGDGISDDWEIMHAGNLTTLTTDGDADGDGESDLDEYGADTGPLDPADALRVTGIVRSPEGLMLSVTWTSKPTRFYRIEHFAGLQSPLTPLLDNIMPDMGPTTTRVVMIAPDASGYFRVVAFAPPGT